MQSHARPTSTSSNRTSSPPQSTATLKHPNVSLPLPALPTPTTTPSTDPEPNRKSTDNDAKTTIPTDAKMSPSSSPTPPPPSHLEHIASHASMGTRSSHLSRKEYMDSLVPPSPSEMARIAQVQLEREKEEKRKGREKERETRLSMDMSRSSMDAQQQWQKHTHENGHKSRHSFSLLSGLRHRKSDVANARSPHSSIDSPAAAASSSVASGPSSDDDLNKSEPSSGENVLVQRAATMIQKTYRGYKTRREMKGLGLDADTRWTHAIRELKFREMVQPRGKEDVPVPGTDATQHEEERLSPGAAEAKRKSSSARYKWRKVATIAARAAADMDADGSTSESGSDSASELSNPEKRRKAHEKREEAKARRRKDARVMGLQYFLEMVDLKHRYGSNLRTYHEEWKKADTKEPFFYWLDYGEGLNIDMASCPRERLDREQVRYLSREERQYYLVQVDDDGRLCWAKNGKRIDTTEEWKDSIHGIVALDDPTPAFSPNTATPGRNKTTSFAPADSSSPSEDGALPSELEAARAAKYASPGFTDEKGVKKVTHLSASTILNTLLRKSVRKNTWIFVADTAFRLYVGLKDSGAFQHSSFVQGSRISAAGLIKIKQGRLASLSPLSGHYRPPASNFRAFVRSLKDEGVDTSHVSISKSYAVLVGLELYMKTQRKGKRLLEKAVHRKDKIVHPEVAKRREDEARDTSESAEKERLFLERQRAEMAVEEGTRTGKVLQKLAMGSSSVVPLTSRVDASTASGARVDQAVAEEVEAEEKAEADQVKTAAEAAEGSAPDGPTQKR